MKNIDKLARHIAQYGSHNILVHTIPKTPYWIIAQCVEKDRWLMILCNPLSNVSYNLGTINNKDHLLLWEELINTEITLKISDIEIAKSLRNKVKNFKKRYIKPYQNLKANTTKKKKNK